MRNQQNYRVSLGNFIKLKKVWVVLHNVSRKIAERIIPRPLYKDSITLIEKKQASVLQKRKINKALTTRIE